MQITNADLIKEAKSILKPRKIANKKLVADVGAALVTEKGNIYTGVCIDTNEGNGFCAERNAIANMVTNGEYKIKKIVAVWINGEVIPPCGVCREWMWQVHKSNWETKVIVAKNKTVTLRKLLPYHWHNKQKTI